MPIISGIKVIKKLEKYGYHIIRRKGSHVRLRHLKGSVFKPITVPLHKEIKYGLLYQIIKDANLSVEEFNKL
ncbi:MAG: type II toxin-antitoxin system HicA family toxin [bacterium]